MEQFDADIKEGSQKIPLIESKLQAKADLCNRLKKELKELEAFDQLESNIKKYKAQLLWLEVQKKEAEVEDMAGTVQGKEQDFFDAQEVLREAVENLNSIGNLDEIQASIDEVMADSEGVSADVDAKRKAHQDKTREIHAVQAQHRKLSDAKKETVARINNITREVRHLTGSTCLLYSHLFKLLH